jgi:hypothetical protein
MCEGKIRCKVNGLPRFVGSLLKTFTVRQTQAKQCMRVSILRVSSESLAQFGLRHVVAGLLEKQQCALKILIHATFS